MRGGAFATAALALLLTAAAPAAPVARFAWFDYRGEDPVDRAAKAGPGDYRNPILQGFYPDPSIERVGSDYYLVNSTFSYFPGLPIFHSRDLVSWTQIGNAIDRPSQFNFKQIGLSRGIFAPDISHHAGTFYLAGTCVDCGGNFVMTAKDPAGPWSDPHWNEIDGIDPSIFFDADGSAWILNNGPPIGKPEYDGHRAIWIQRFDPKTVKPFGERTLLVNGGVHFADKPIWAEGPHIFTRDGWYYLMTAEGGTAENHSEVIYRSRSVTGPYMPGPNNPILTQRGLNPGRPFPITSAGHADFVTTPGGDWWTIFLATRPYKDDFYNIGRETFLLPVRWKDGWPEVTAPDATISYALTRPALPRGKAAAVPNSGAFHVRDDFTGPKLAPYWMQIRATETGWRNLSGGALAIDARPVAIGGAGQAAFLGRRLQHHWATAETAMDFAPRRAGDRAGIAVVQDTAYFYTLTLARTGAGTVIALEKRSGPKDPVDGVTVASAPYTGATVRLRIVLRGEVCDFLYARADGSWQVLAKDQDATILSTRTAGGFIGAMVGPFARAGE
ncbi:glycoside hydrolase family 43 protein [Sphingomonas sp. QA11]|uniref:glycoside hydrolase family 43 protein n=1 Tax=Sphingomonas sp. QA11 TaxID=2950605 RepID=UPI00234B9293|nr:glycoside hydrolase family 43 protein [Sphingomonas sp. QA11]WCM25812.1 glycoside hydrolase family 43 protein [Sphingomonas sp. QA11]